MARLRATTPEAPRVFDTMAGQINIWPILSADASQLAAEIAAGQHDGYLSLLGHVDQSQHEGGRAEVQAAIRARKGED